MARPGLDFRPLPSRTWVLTRTADGFRREGTDRRFRIAFDLSRPVGPPPAPWGQ